MTAGSRRGPTGSMVIDQLREGILSGRYPAGTRIRQETLAAEFGTSRLPVRDAFQRLESEGLITLIPNSGAWVASLDLNESIEMYKIREALEPLALAESIPYLTSEKLEDLEAQAEAIGRCEDPAEYIRLDRIFHLAMYDSERLPRLTPMIEQFWNMTQKYRRAFTKQATGHYWDATNNEHSLILEAVREGDAEAASALARLHIRRTRLILTDHAELFDS